MRAENRFSPGVWVEIGAPSHGMWVLQPERPSQAPVLVVATGFHHRFSLSPLPLLPALLPWPECFWNLWLPTQQMPRVQAGRCPQVRTGRSEEVGLHWKGECLGHAVGGGGGEQSMWVVPPGARPSRLFLPSSRVPATHRPLVVFGTNSLLDQRNGNYTVDP